MAPRVRFAPSPTGYLHVGGARTALFNWLFARRHGGVFVLRIEDTDAERSSTEMVEGILDGLRWLGLDWDEGPLDRRAVRAVFPVRAFRPASGDGGPARRRGPRVLLLLHAGGIEGADARRQDGRARDRIGVALRSRVLPADRRRSRRARARSRPARRAIQGPVRHEGTTRFDDLVHGPIKFDGANIEDFVIVRSDGHPTYHLSVVADDVEMAITHVVRGDDHISNTPKHILLYRALGAPVPQFAHVPLILGPDKKRLSKRHGATSVMEYAAPGHPSRSDGQLSRAARMVARRGRPRAVHAGRARRGVFARGDQRRQRGVQSGEAGLVQPAAHHAARARRARAPRAAVVRGGRLVERRAPRRSSRVVLRRARAVEAAREAARRSSSSQGRFFFMDEIEYDAGGRPEASDAEWAIIWPRWMRRLRELAAFDAASLEAALRSSAAARGVKAASLIHACRVAVTGKAVSPGLFDVLTLLGRRRVHERLLGGAARLPPAPEPVPLFFPADCAFAAVLPRVKIFSPH